MGDPAPKVWRTKVTLGLAVAFALIGFWQMFWTVRIRTAYVQTEVRLLSHPTERELSLSGRMRQGYKFVVSYSYVVDGRKYTARGGTHDEPRNGLVVGYYLRGDPRISTIEHPDYYLLQGLASLLGAVAAGSLYLVERRRISQNAPNKSLERSRDR